MDTQSALNNAILLGELMAAMMVVDSIVSNLSYGTDSKSWTSIAVAMFIMVQALKSLSNAEGDIDKAVDTMRGLMGALAGMNAFMEYTATKFKSSAGAKSLIAISASLYLAVLSIKKLAKMNPDEMRKGLGVYSLPAQK